MVENKVGLITYAERFGCGYISDFNRIIDKNFKDLFGHIHLLPTIFPHGGKDAGFDCITHLDINRRLVEKDQYGWEAIKDITGKDRQEKGIDLMVDVIINHLSAKNPMFQDVLKKGEKSKYWNSFLRKDSDFDGNVFSEADLEKIYRPRPGKPFTEYTLNNGEKIEFWTTFSPQQIDVNFKDEDIQDYFEKTLKTLDNNGVKLIRLDAAGYIAKKPGTKCFLIPESYEYIKEFSQKAKELKMDVLVELHHPYEKILNLAKRVEDYGDVYDFQLPPLILDGIFRDDARNIKSWLEKRPDNVYTVLDTHDGIGIIDSKGLLSTSEEEDKDRRDNLIQTIHKNTKKNSEKVSGGNANNLDIYQINTTFYDALGRDDRSYLMARAIQFFTPGIPQIYYTGLLAGENDMKLLYYTFEGRDVNRHYYTEKEIKEALEKPAVQKQIELIKFRNNHPAFDGEFEVKETKNNVLYLNWKNGDNYAYLWADLKDKSYIIGHSQVPGAEFKV